MIRILAADGMEKSAIAELTQKGFEVVEQHYEADALGSALADFDVITVRSATKLRQPILEEAAKAGRLKLIIRGGVGMDNIDIPCAESLGMTVRNTPASSSASVAELTIGHMFSLARFIGLANATMRNGEWNKKQYEGTEIAGKTLGLIGMGRISREVAKRAAALGMDIIYTDILGEDKNLPYRFCSQEEILKTADYISLHIPALGGKPVIGKEELAMMKPTAYLMNIARGELIDEEALCDALDAGALAGAALDVFAQEPAQNQRILTHPKISMTPHIGAATKEAQARIGAEIVDIITAFFA